MSEARAPAQESSENVSTVCPSPPLRSFQTTFSSPEIVPDSDGSQAGEDNVIEDVDQPDGDEDEEGPGEDLGGSDEDERDAEADRAL